MALRILIVDAELESIPDAIKDHATVRSHAKRVDRPISGLLLTQDVHRPAMKGLDAAERRGRPDITHHCLLHLLEHPLSKVGHLEVAVHTRHDDLLRFSNETRLPRSDVRFQGVLAKVLRERPDEKVSPLVWHGGTPKPQKVVEVFAAGPVIRLDAEGAAISPLQLVDQARDGDLTVVIGGFAHGGFSDGWSKTVPKTASIWRDELNAWVVAAEVAAAWRSRYGPH